MDRWRETLEQPEDRAGSRPFVQTLLQPECLPRFVRRRTDRTACSSSGLLPHNPGRAQPCRSGLRQRPWSFPGCSGLHRASGGPSARRSGESQVIFPQAQGRPHRGPSRSPQIRNSRAPPRWGANLSGRWRGDEVEWRGPPVGWASGRH